MKDKRAEQLRQREAHKERKREAKKRKRRAAPPLSRGNPSRLQKEDILIVCEGQQTEPSYFKKFKLATAEITAVGEGYNTLSLVERAKEIAADGAYDQVWCVFDKDDYSNEQFNNAILKAEALGFRVAYSNQAFEYWLILHFEDHQGGGLHRNRYCKKLNDHLQNFGLRFDCDYKEIDESVFELMLAKVPNTDKSRLEFACERAEKILSNCSLPYTFSVWFLKSHLFHISMS